MKRPILFLAILLLASTSLLQARSLQAMLNYTVFNTIGKGPFIETYLSVSGQSAVYSVNEKGAFQAIIEITFIFRQENQIVEFDKYQLFSPEVEDTLDINFDFIDQQRYFIPEGDYELEILVSDLNSGKPPLSVIQPLSVYFENDKLCFSGIQLVESFHPTIELNILSKGGYDLVPMVNNFFPESISKLTYYTEIYNADRQFGADEKFLVSSQIRSFESGAALKDYVNYKRVDAKPVIPVFSEFDITRLPSGNYTLVVETRNKQNELMASNELFFQRSNPGIQFDISDLATVDVNATFANRINSADTLMEFIRCLDPIATDLEKNFIYKQSQNADMKTRQQFFYNFWLTRDMNNPEKAWQAYFTQVQIVNAAYKTPIHKGYETDRGRVYLKYGPPNVISESYNEPSSYPYEIWHYYELSDNQRNKKFVFYTHDMITNNFKLLHSDAIGEISNYKWQIFLNNRWYDPYNVDAERSPDIYGGKADDYFRNPR